ncbi:MAG: hypothetical protein KTR31_21115 [Myxococcales bacterium]|nr:hypothetical protein [Myxococcales bacterium]
MKRIVVSLAAALLTAAPAYATSIDEPHEGNRPHTLDLHAGVSVYSVGGAVGARYGIPIVPNGFVPPINNSVYINFGADLYFVGDVFGVGGGNAIGIPVALQWNFYFSDQWSAYAEAGFNAFLWLGDGDFFRVGSQNLVTAVGGRYHFSDSMALIGRVGSPYAAIGLELSF